MLSNYAFERSARQRCCRVPSSLRSSALAQRGRYAAPCRPTNLNSLARFQANNPETTNVQSRNGGIKRH